MSKHPFRWVTPEIIECAHGHAVAWPSPFSEDDEHFPVLTFPAVWPCSQEDCTRAALEEAYQDREREVAVMTMRWNDNEDLADFYR